MWGSTSKWLIECAININRVWRLSLKQTNTQIWVEKYEWKCEFHINAPSVNERRESEFSTNTRTLKHFLTPTIKYRNRSSTEWLVGCATNTISGTFIHQTKKGWTGFWYLSLKQNWLASLTRQDKQMIRWAYALIQTKARFWGLYLLKQSSSIVTLNLSGKLWVKNVSST